MGRVLDLPTNPQETTFDRYTRWLKNNPLIAILMLAVIVLTAAFALWNQIRTFMYTASSDERTAAPTATPSPPPSLDLRDPTINLIIGTDDHLHPSTLTIYNESGPDVLDIASNLRLFFLTTEYDEKAGPVFAQGQASTEHPTYSWWYVPSLAAGKKAQKDARDIFDNFLNNARAAESQLHVTVARRIVGIDIRFRRKSDGKRFVCSVPAELFLWRVNGSNAPLLERLEMSDFCERLLKKQTRFVNFQGGNETATKC